MSEITKLYENAGIKPTKNWQSCLNCKLKTETRYDDWGSEYLTCNRLEMPEKCPDAKEYYPLFTAEKQISILQFCLKWGQVHILKGIDDEYRIENSYYRKGYQPTIADALANYINEKWEKLTPEEKQQVKGILRG